MTATNPLYLIIWVLSDRADTLALAWKYYNGKHILPKVYAQRYRVSPCMIGSVSVEWFWELDSIQRQAGTNGLINDIRRRGWLVVVSRLLTKFYHTSKEYWCTIHFSDVQAVLLVVQYCSIRNSGCMLCALHKMGLTTTWYTNQTRA